MLLRNCARRLPSVLPVLVSLLSAQPVWAGTCALCREALKSGGSSGLVQGFYWSILLIGGVPLVIMGVAAALLWRAHGRHRNSPQPKLP